MRDTKGVQVSDAALNAHQCMSSTHLYLTTKSLARVDAQEAPEDVVYEIRSVYVVEWENEDHNCSTKYDSWSSLCPASGRERGHTNEEVVGGSPSISQFLWNNCDLLWSKIAGPPLTRYPSLLPVRARGESQAVPIRKPANYSLMTMSEKLSTRSGYRAIVRRLQWLIHAQ